MEKAASFGELTFKEMYDDPSLIDGTVYYLDYFHHSMYLISALKKISEVLFNVEKDSVSSTEIIEHRYKMGLFYTSIFLTSQSIENLIKARALYELKETGELENYPTLKDVLDNYWKCKGHEISKIVSRSKISLNEEEKVLIENIKPYFIWGGRYPVPFSRKEYVNRVQENLQLSFNFNSGTILEGMFNRFAGEMGLD